jgi:hypothetical protein
MSGKSGGGLLFSSLLFYLLFYLLFADGPPEELGPLDFKALETPTLIVGARITGLRLLRPLHKVRIA